MFEGSDACVMPVLTMEEAARHPHNVARDAFRTVQRGGAKPGAEQGAEAVLVPQPAPKLSRTPGSSQAWQDDSVYVPGKDTLRILGQLGYSTAAIDQLLEEGAVGAAEQETEPLGPTQPRAKL